MNLAKTPAISVLMPLYNGAARVEEALGGALAQTLHDIEVIVVDDGSTDGGLEIARRTAARHPSRRVIFLSHEGNRGAASARNTALAAASGEWVLFADSDDRMEPEMCAEMLRAARREELDSVMCDVWFEYRTGVKRMNADFRLREGETLADLILRWRIAPTLWNKLLRRELITRHGLDFREGDNVGEDFYFCARYFYHARRAARVALPLYRYRVDEGSLMGRARRSPAIMSQVIANMRHVEEFYASRPDAARYAPSVMFAKLFAKKPLATTADRECDRMWLATFRETDPYIWRNRDEKISYRLIEWLLSKRLTLLKNIVCRFLVLARRAAGLV